MSYNETSNMLNHVNAKKPRNLNNPSISIDDDYLFSASCQEATGLIPTPAKDAYEAANYEDLYSYLPPTPEDVPQSVMAEGIHQQLRTKVEAQNRKNKK